MQQERNICRMPGILLNRALKIIVLLEAATTTINAMLSFNETFSVNLKPQSFRLRRCTECCGWVVSKCNKTQFADGLIPTTRHTTSNHTNTKSNTNTIMINYCNSNSNAN